MLPRSAAIWASVAFLGLAACGTEDGPEPSNANASALTAGGLSAILTISSDWGNGYCADVALQNVGSSTITSWEVKVDLKGSTLSNGWSAALTTSGTGLIAKPAAHNATLTAGAKANFGFCANAPNSTARAVVAAVVANGSGGTGSGGSTAAGGTTAAGGSTAKGGTSSTGGNTTTLTKFVGNITTSNGVDANGMKYSKYWNQITPENAGKWGSVQSTPTSAFNWSTLDSVYNYANTNGIIFKQHTFVWGAQQPSGTPNLAQVETWIKSFCTRYPKTKIIDVVNEPPPHTTPNYTAALGAGEGGSYPWIVKAFKLARQYCPNAILVLNDYNNIEYTDQENHFIDIVKNARANGAPIDAVGCQAHALKGRSAASVQANINTMAAGTGLPVYITEYDIGGDDATQLSNFQAHFPVFMNTASVKGVTVWGWINGKTWIADSGLVNNTTPRSSMTWLMKYLGRPVPPS